MPVPATLSPDETALVEHAEKVARAAHKGQLDKAGLPYFESHVADVHRRVVSYGGGAIEQIAALLHDVLEDTVVTENDLRNEGFPEEALVIVKLLTIVPDEPKTDYYERIRQHEPARRVKVYGDIASNTDPDRLALLPDERRTTLTLKYAEATRQLTNATRDK
jgi:(p)ppGpp synthase/HD superfamily hydrolase